MEVVYQKHSLRRKKAMKVWEKVYKDFHKNKSADDIAKKYNRTRSWVYWILRKYKNNEI